VAPFPWFTWSGFSLPAQFFLLLYPGSIFWCLKSFTPAQFHWMQEGGVTLGQQHPSIKPLCVLQSTNEYWQCCALFFLYGPLELCFTLYCHAGRTRSAQLIWWRGKAAARTAWNDAVDIIFPALSTSPSAQSAHFARKRRTAGAHHSPHKSWERSHFGIGCCKRAPIPQSGGN
jgi:hypothetical protein